jgi:hypothetical protein
MMDWHIKALFTKTAINNRKKFGNCNKQDVRREE